MFHYFLIFLSLFFFFRKRKTSATIQMTANPPKSRCCLPVTSLQHDHRHRIPTANGIFGIRNRRLSPSAYRQNSPPTAKNTTATFRFPDSGMVCLPQPSACAYACGFPSCFMIWLSLFHALFQNQKSPEDPARSPSFSFTEQSSCFLLSVYRFLCSYYASPFINPSTQSL